MKRALIGFLALALAMTTFGETIKIGLRPVPPYVMQDRNGAYSGLDYEIIVAALAVKGHTLSVQNYPLNRLVPAFQAKEVSAAAPVLPASNPGGYLSEVFLVYNNVALSLGSSGLNLKGIADLKGRAVIAFPNAKTVLGPDFAAAVEGNARYQEDPQQVTQIRLLFAKRVDVAVGESRILRYFIKSPETGVDASVPVVEHAIFPPTQYRVVFATQALADDFNAGLKAIRADGSYDRILQKYSK